MMNLPCIFPHTVYVINFSIMTNKIKYMMIITSLMSSIFLHFHTSLADTFLSEAINHLFKYIEESHCMFIRNEKEYDAKAAVEHIRKKYSHFENEIHSVEDFIELCATKSFLTGKPYFVKCAGHIRIPIAEWLRKELINFYGTSQAIGKSS